MTLDCRSKGKVKIDMIQYIDSILQDLPTEYNGLAVTPATDHLYMSNIHCKPLPGEPIVLFHAIVAKLLFLCKCGRLDIQTAINYLTTS